MSAPRYQEEVFSKGYDLRLVKRLLRYALPFRAAFLASAALLCVVTLLEQIGPYLTKIIIDDHISKGDVNGILPWAGWFLASVLGVFLFQTCQTIFTAHVVQSLILDLRMKLFRHLHAQPLQFFDRTPVGSLMTRVISDVEQVDDFYSQGVAAVFNDLFTVLSVATALMVMDWKLGLVALSVLPFLAWSTAIFRRRFRENFRKERAMRSRINSFLTENISGMTTVQTYLREEKNGQKFDLLSGQYRDISIQQIVLNAVFRPLAEILSALAVVLVLIYGGWRHQVAGLPLGVVVATLWYVQRFFQPLQDLADKYNSLQSSMASAERIFSLLDKKPELMDPARPVPAPVLQGRVEFENVWFAYLDEEWVLKDLSFKMEPGQRFAVVGPTGAGKTSLISVLMRFYHYQKGRVKLDGILIEDMARGDFRRQVGLVLQDAFLFSGSVLENVRLSNPSISRERVEAACRQVEAHEFISRLPKGYDSEIGERGNTLSAGQKQLLAFARALVFDPRLLILDEATANVDTFTEGRIQQAMEVLQKGRSSITIAHRLSTVVHADRILVVKDGRIAEQGTHTELMKQGGLYRSLVELQFKEIESL